MAKNTLNIDDLFQSPTLPQSSVNIQPEESIEQQSKPIRRNIKISPNEVLSQTGTKTNIFVKNEVLQWFEEYIEKTGLKKGYIFNEAILEYLERHDK